MAVPERGGFRFYDSVSGRHVFNFVVSRIHSPRNEDSLVDVVVESARDSSKRYEVTLDLGILEELEIPGNPNINVRVNKVRKGTRGDIVADFGFYAYKAYRWEKIR